MGDRIWLLAAMAMLLLTGCTVNHVTNVYAGDRQRLQTFSSVPSRLQAQLCSTEFRACASRKRRR